MKPGIIIRAFLYMLIAAIPPWIAFFSGLIDTLLEGKEPLMHWAVWCLTISTSLLQAAVALRCFLDGSAERSRQDDKPKPT